jgi:hypothetical protein
MRGAIGIVLRQHGQYIPHNRVPLIFSQVRGSYCVVINPSELDLISKNEVGNCRLSDVILPRSSF